MDQSASSFEVLDFEEPKFGWYPFAASEVEQVIAGFDLTFTDPVELVTQFF